MKNKFLSVILICAFTLSACSNESSSICTLGNEKGGISTYEFTYEKEVIETIVIKHTVKKKILPLSKEKTIDAYNIIMENYNNTAGYHFTYEFQGDYFHTTLKLNLSLIDEHELIESGLLPIEDESQLNLASIKKILKKKDWHCE